VHYHQLAYGHRRARRRSNDQLLPNAVRDRHRADQPPPRDGVPGDGTDPALGSLRQPSI